MFPRPPYLFWASGSRQSWWTRLPLSAALWEDKEMPHSTMGKKQVVSKYKNIVGWVSWKSSDIYIYRDALSLLWLSPEVSADTTIEKKSWQITVMQQNITLLLWVIKLSDILYKKENVRHTKKDKEKHSNVTVFLITSLQVMPWSN